MSASAISAALLRRELSARGEAFARKNKLQYQLSYGESPVVVFQPDEDGHGNFLPETFQAIRNNPTWLRRLGKIHTQAKTTLPKSWDRKWCELDSCNSSDALLMNVFCHPDAFTGGRVAGLLGVDRDTGVEFGVRARAPLMDSRTDRTEVDMVMGELLVEAKLTESDFQTASPELVERYSDFDGVFDRWQLPRRGERYDCSRLIRNVLAAHAMGYSFCVLADARRPDLREQWFSVMRCVRDVELRTRCKMLAWQELAKVLPERLREFLREKYGIGADGPFGADVCD